MRNLSLSEIIIFFDVNVEINSKFISYWFCYLSLGSSTGSSWDLLGLFLGAWVLCGSQMGSWWVEPGTQEVSKGSVQADIKICACI